MWKINKAVIFAVVMLACAGRYSWGADVSMHSLGKMGRLPDTGQTLCYDVAGIIIPTCPAPDAVLAQDGSYVSVASSPSYKDNSDGTTTDNRTGLMWANCTTGGCNGGTTINYTGAVSYCEGLIFATYSNWRVPNIKELISIVDYGRYSPTINQTYFPSTAPTIWWSSTSKPGSLPADFANALTVHFQTGLIFSSTKTDSFYIRCVRGGP